jgi:uncharacterized cofD-like protein
MKVVALGGGHGLSRTLQAARLLTHDIVAVVSTADDGGSSGRLRAEFDVPPPGDLRMALLALADPAKSDEVALWAHRFAGDGPLAGHNLGNLMLTALWQHNTGQPNAIVSGLTTASRMLGVSARVLPVTATTHRLLAAVETSAGATDTIAGQSHIAATPHRITHLQLEPRARAIPEVLENIRAADLIVVGPGSWFTSVLAVLCVDGVCEAIAASNATVATIVNLRPQPGEADDFRAHDYMESLFTHHPELRVDAWVVDQNLRSEAVDGSAQSRGAQVVVGDLADSAGAHAPERLADALKLLKIGTH